MKIDIITPVYNGEKFIESCLKSVIEQKCPDINHIIIDGRSSDRTVNIVREYAEKFHHIRCLSEKDRGQSDAMNKGIKMAKGEIIGILNVDDFYEPNVLNRVQQLFATLPEPSLLVGNCNVLNDRDRVRLVMKPGKLTFNDLLLGHLINPFPVNPSSYFYHKSLHDRIGLYDIEEHYAMDFDFIIKAVRVANVKYVDEIWGNFRNIKGTKTYNDYATGLGLQRSENLLETYRKNLPTLQKLQLALGKVFGYSRVRIGYFSTYPDRIIPSIKKRTRKIFDGLKQKSNK